MSDPAALRLTIALPGLSALSVGLSRLRTEIADWTGFWKDRFGPFFYSNNLQNFVSEGGLSGASWAPLSAAYELWKRKRFPGSYGILVRSGAMKASLLAPDAAGSVFRPGPTSLEIGTSIPYAIYHQMGTRRMPQRSPLRVTDSFMTVAGQSMQKWIETAWQERRAAFVADVQSGIADVIA